MRCLVTESRATFFDTTTAYPFPSSGRITEKCADEKRRPLLSAEGNNARGSLSRRGNTGSDGEARAPGATTFLYDLAA
jgi:hypothetical protein